MGQAPSRSSDASRPLEARLVKRRLLSLLGVGARGWSRILKVNLVGSWPGKSGKGDAFPMGEARASAELLRPRLAGKTVLVLGLGTARALGLRARYLEWQDGGGFWAVVVPHPSGVNRWWNEPANRRTAREFLGRVVRT